MQNAGHRTKDKFVDITVTASNNTLVSPFNAFGYTNTKNMGINKRSIKSASILIDNDNSLSFGIAMIANDGIFVYTKTAGNYIVRLNLI